ncbi:hypothetical protein [Achromobacter sp.]|uniref:hypothetical protein n=1 Tax=Achromobacter sp. TaxID=134375 RepID=UPI002582E677|nr:hypothetical protein [Achromobacter sp.]
MSAPKKPVGIPMEDFIRIGGDEFDRNFKLLLKERPEYTQPGLRDALLDAVLSLKDAGGKHKESQKRRAKKSRAIKNEGGETLDDVIHTLARNHPDETPSELWPHLESAIRDWCDAADDCRLIEHDIKDSRSIMFTKGDRQDSLTFGTFRKKLKK